MQVKIQTPDDIINFIKDYPKLSFAQCSEILNSYVEQPIFWNDGSNKQDIINFINDNKESICNSRTQLPLLQNF